MALTSAIVRAWLDVEQGPIYVLVVGGSFVVEYPEETKDPEREAILRIFTSEAECRTYLGQVQVFYEEPLRIVKASTPALFGFLERIQLSTTLEYGCPARLDICTVRADEHPETIDTLWSAFRCRPELTH